MSKPDPHALDATMSAPGVTPRRPGEGALPAPTPDVGPAPATATPPGAAATPMGDATEASPSGAVRTPDITGDDVLLRPGETLGRYVIGERVGAGGMGYVFRAKDPDLGREVAIKVLRTGGDGSGGALERRLLREAQAMATLSHDNLANVYDIGTSAGRVFVAMELIDGITLRALIADPARSWREKLAAVVAAGRGLAAAHSAGVIHRDFKPDNVLISRSGRVKVVDFGLARAEQDAAEAIRAGGGALPADLHANLTQTGALLGTPAYMAPEQHAGETVDARADQFAFAVTAWEAVYGRRPFPSEAYSSLVAAVRAHEILPPPRGTGVPPALEAALRRALSPEPRARFTSIDALLAAIDAAIRPRRWGWIAAAAALVVASGAGIAGYALSRDRERAPTASEPIIARSRTTPAPLPPRPPGPRRTTVKVAALDFTDLARLRNDRDANAVVLTRMGQAAVIRAHEAEAIDCYDRTGLQRPGTIVIEYDLDREGRVLGNRALENGLGDDVARCLLDASRQWRFPASPDGEKASVRFPFRFAPARRSTAGATASGAAVGDDEDEAQEPDGVRIELPPLPGLPDGLDVPLPLVPAPPEPPPEPAPPEPAPPAPRHHAP